jgi:hypothetical protein
MRLLQGWHGCLGRRPPPCIHETPVPGEPEPGAVASYWSTFQT